MEVKIKQYESYLAQAIKSPHQTGLSKTELISYHQNMLQQFQHERLIHLLVTFFFAAITLALLYFVLEIFMWYDSALYLYFIPVYVLTVVLFVLTGFYIKHYYFLENHIQSLYKYTEKLYNIK